MRAGVTREEVTYLAKTMELKFAFSGPPIGGAKSGIDFDPSDPARDAVLDRWFDAVAPFLKTCYGTGGDVNVDERRDIAPRCARVGLRHHQEGTVRGHLRPSSEEEVTRILDQLRTDVLAPVVGGPYGMEGVTLSVSDMVTGFATARATLDLFALRGEDPGGRRVIVEGFGNVGGACALFLARAGMRVVGLMDSRGGLVSPDGLDAAAMEELVLNRAGGLIPPHPGRVPDGDWGAVDRAGAEVFIPAAISGSLTRERLETLAAGGVETIVCGANQPFREAYLGATETQQYADATFQVIADVVGSMGQARTFHYLMGDSPSTEPDQIFEAVASGMADAVNQVVAAVGDSRRGLMAAALELALDRVGANS